MNIIILEDNKNHREQLIGLLNEWSLSSNHKLTILSYASVEDFWSYHTKDQLTETDLFLLDIKINKSNGLDFAKLIRKNGYNRAIVFTTSFSEFVIDGYDVNATGFLIKPVEYEKLKKVLDKILRSFANGVYTFKTTTRSQLTLFYKDICFFECNNHSIEIITTKAQYSQRAKFEDLKHILPSVFIQIHRSYIVNIDFVEMIQDSEVYLSTGVKLPVSKTYMDTLKNSYATSLLYSI